MTTLHTSRRGLLAALLLQAALLAGAGSAHAAVIAWGAPTNITPGLAGDLDVSTTGTVVGAFNLGPIGVPPTTINTVTFNPFAVPTGAPSVTLGNFTLATAGIGGLGTATGAFVGAPFSTLSVSYQSLLGTLAFTPNGTMTLTMAGLTLGQSYEFQWWANLSSATIATAGTSVTLNDNTTNAFGGLGQFAIGTFIADNTASQLITFRVGKVGVSPDRVGAGGCPPAPL